MRLGFKLRGKEVSRLEAFSDTVFGFALTLLVVSLSTPQNIDDLTGLLRGLPVFAVCFGMLYSLWNCHYVYCRRFGLEDATVRTLTGLLLFTVLFFVYPLKFIFTLFINGFLGLDRSVNIALRSESDLALAFIVYGVGWVATMAIFAAMYGYAFKQRESLGLSKLEAHHTRFGATGFVLISLVGVLSIILACVLHGKWLAFSGFCYCLVGAVTGLHSSRENRIAKEIQASEGSTELPPQGDKLT